VKSCADQRKLALREATGKMKNVLIIEDNEPIREALAITLRKHLQGCTILTACNGEEGISILSSTPLDLILTDLQMPIKDGYGVIEHRNKHYPEVPLLAMTANYTAEVKAKLNALGITQHLEKPFDFDTVSATIRDTLHATGENGTQPGNS
jgi:DNA-binding NtrC family response regulator